MDIKKDLPWSYSSTLKFGNRSPLAKSGLREIGVRVGTDKITHHHYDFHYPRFLEHFRELRDGAMLEIGIDRGASLAMWLDYFDKAFIYGIDINVSAEGPRYKIIKADQNDLNALNVLVKTQIKHPVFLVVDDGSHLPEHQAASFDFLFKELLVPGGVYIIEDVEVSYWTKGGLYGNQTRYGYRHRASIIELFKDIVDDVNDEFLTDANRELQGSYLKDRLSPETRACVSCVAFAKNCIIITKKTEQERFNNHRAYRFSHKL